jgi:NitT/TauT family transport system substrate-binding protein
MKRSRITLSLAACGALLLAACQPAESPSTSTGAEESAAAGESAGASEAAAEPASVRLQLQWTPQAQFGGYYAAEEQGYYAEENLTVEFLPGGGDIVPQQAGSAPDGPEFTIAWVPKVLQAREAGSDLVQIAQVFQRAATLAVSWRDDGIEGPEDWAGKRIGAWPFGNELEVIATATLAGLTQGEDYTRVEQDFDMSELLAAYDGCEASDTDCVDVAEAMVYNEYAQLLETENPETGELFTPDDLNVLDYNEHGTAMLQDALWARESWLAEEGNEDVAIRFLRASFRGWIYCRDNPDDCVQYSLDQGSLWGQGHLNWMMNEINALIWPSPDGIGVLDQAALEQTIETATAGEILTAEPDEGAFRSDLTEAALEGIEEDATGEDWEKPVVEVTPGGE